MQRKSITSVLCVGTMAAALVLSGCSSTTTSNYATTPVTPTVSTPAATAGMTGADVAAKLTAGSFTFTTADQAAKIAKLTNKDAISKGTKFKIEGTDGNSVDVTVLELSKPEKMADLKTENDGQIALAKQISKTFNAEYVDVGDANLFVMVNYLTADKALATKVISSIAKK